MKYLWIIVLAVVVLVGGWYLIAFRQSARFDGDKGLMKPADTTETTNNTVPSPSTSTAAVGGGTTGEIVQEIQVDGSNFAFLPKEIRVKEGTRVRVVSTNKGGTHNFVVDEFNARTQKIQTGATESIEFVADKKGIFEYYCSVGTHRQMGMVGKLIVE